MSFISTDKGRVLVKEEDTYGTDAVDDALGTVDEDLVYQAIRTRNIITPERTNVSNPSVKSGMASSAIGTIPNECSVAASVKMTGLRASDVDLPEWHAWFAAANMKSTVDPGVSVTYVPELYPDASLSIWELKDNLEDAKARLQRTTGARGTFTINASLDEQIYFDWSGKGKYYHPGKAASFYDSYSALATKADGTTSFGSHDQYVTITTATEGYDYEITVDAVTVSHTGGAAEDTTDIAAALVLLLNAEAGLNVTASNTAEEIKITGDSVGARFYVKIGRREDNMTIFSKERWSSDDDIMYASEMTATLGGLEVDLASVSLAFNTQAESVRTITGSSGTTRVLNTKGADVNVEVSMELLDADEATYNMIMDRWEDDGFITFDLEGGNGSTDLKISADRLQIANPSMTETGGFVGWTITGMLSGQWDEIGGGDDFSLSLTHK